MDLNRNQEVQLRVAAHHLEDQHIASIDDMSRSQLERFDVNLYLHEVIGQMKSLVEDSMPLLAIDLECSKLCELLNAHVHSRLTRQSYQPNEPLIKSTLKKRLSNLFATPGGGPRVVVSTAAFHARVPGSVPGLGGFKETKMFLPHPRVKVSIVGSLRD